MGSRKWLVVNEMRRLTVHLAILVASFGISATAAHAVTRSEVATTVTQACGSGGSGCMAAVNSVLDQFGKRCRVEDRVAAQGLADAVLAISQTNTDLAVEISKTVVMRAKNCFQVAYGEILDGTGTAAVGNLTPEGRDSSPPESGSPG